MSEKVPRPPAGTRAPGRRLWESIVAEFTLTERELALLREATRTVDQLDALAAVVARDGVIEPVTGKAHPALVESRQLRLVLSRLLGGLDFPSESTGGAAVSDAAREMVEARWKRQRRGAA